ncbi:MAG TPA: caspase family protein [Bryobacteraceae bacterium]|nr:caspase family protein [Bryobacteraceae bacterium]
MAVRAIIVAVENYGSVAGGGLVSKLEGTLEDAEKFRVWLLQKKSVQPRNITFLADPTAAAIELAFRDLVDNGQNDTEELYVFYSGHGFSTNDNPLRQKPADILVGAEFQNLNDSGKACLKLSEIQFTLYQCLGPGTHFYFIDACRNPVSAKDVRPGEFGWTRPFSQLGQPAVFTMFSAERGNFAAVRSGFAPAVVAGLGGRGRAKRRDGLQMWVSFDSLRTYLEMSLAQKVAPEPGPGAGRILRIDPIPTYTCTVQVKNAGGSDRFTATMLNAFSVQVGQPVSFQGGETTLRAFPDDYFVQVTHSQFALSPPDPAKAELYDDCTVEFEKTTQLLGGPPPTFAAPPPVPVSINGPAASVLEITNLHTGEVSPLESDFTGTLQPGPYQVRVLESGWSSVRSFRFLVDQSLTGPGGLHIDAASRDPSRIRDSLLGLVPGQHDTARADFSESLGPMAAQDLGLWLSILGASRILENQFHKLQNLPLMSFDDVQPGGSPIYVLSGAEGPRGISQAAIGAPGAPAPQVMPMQGVQGVPGLYELRSDTPPGMNLVYFRAGDAATCATVAYCLPNRATLFVLATSGAGETRIQQFILPLAKLRQYLTRQEQDRQPPNLLEAVRFAVLAQRELSRLRSPGANLSGLDGDPRRVQEWNNLLYGKWLDPAMAVMAAYELARNRGAGSPPDSILVAIANLRAFFAALPDAELIAKIAGLPYTEPVSLPLFLTGLRAMEHPELLMPLPLGQVDYVGPWITWIGI